MGGSIRHDKIGYSILIFLTLLIGVLRSFTWGENSTYFNYLLAVLMLSLLLITRVQNKKLLIGIVIFLGCNVASVLSGVLTTSLPINWSWVIQVSLIPFIYLSIKKLLTNYRLEFVKISKFFLYIVVIFQLIIIVVAVSQYSLKDVFSLKFIFSNEQRNFVQSIKDVIGLDKTLMPLLGVFLFLFVSSFEKIKFHKIIFSITLAYVLIVGSKSVAFGFVVYFVIRCFLEVKNTLFRVTTFSFAVAIIFYVFVLNLDIFNAIMILDGRYFIPVFYSEDFWSRPFGVGMGNYTLAAYANEIIVDTKGLFTPVWIHTDMVDKFDMFPIAESDLLLFTVSFGWLPSLLAILYIIWVFIEFIFGLGSKSKMQVNGFLLFVFLLFSGVFQDFLSMQFIWILYSLTLLMMKKIRL